MSVRGESRVVYWDASALLSAYVKDRHSGEARKYLQISGHNLVSSLAHAEVLAVMGRMERGHAIDLGKARAAYLSGPWRWVASTPTNDVLERLAYRCSLRGADLWHLAMSLTLSETLPELSLLTYDDALAEAAVGQGLPPPAG